MHMGTWARGHMHMHVAPCARGHAQDRHARAHAPRRRNRFGVTRSDAREIERQLKAQIKERAAQLDPLLCTLSRTLTLTLTRTLTLTLTHLCREKLKINRITETAELTEISLPSKGDFRVISE